MLHNTVHANSIVSMMQGPTSRTPAAIASSTTGGRFWQNNNERAMIALSHAETAAVNSAAQAFTRRFAELTVAPPVAQQRQEVALVAVKDVATGEQR
jgi:hypothetical protein